MCLLFEKTFSNDALKPAIVRDHWNGSILEKSKDVEYVKMLKEKLGVKPNLIVFISSVGADSAGELDIIQHLS